MAVVVIYETRYYFNETHVKFKFLPDDDVSDARMTINLDITVASPCARELSSKIFSLNGLHSCGENED
jgi:hypothetical protein